VYALRRDTKNGVTRRCTTQKGATRKGVTWRSTTHLHQCGGVDAQLALVAVVETEPRLMCGVDCDAKGMASEISIFKKSRGDNKHIQINLHIKLMRSVQYKLQQKNDL
jgi:hypothetical protein